MAKFLSHDGVDSNGVRAQVMVQTGTGRIKEIVGRGKAAEDGSYRNVEVVFDPDNPLLKRKVYALLDTTAKDLWEYVQAAQADQRDIAYRIESQRKRGVDRAKPFEDLVHTEEVVRVLAAIDTVFSHEAKTNPKEDPSGDNPSALDQDTPARGVAASTGAVTDVTTVLAALATARQQGMSDTVIDTLVAHALAAGAGFEQVMKTGFDTPAAHTPSVVSRAVAVEERPWNAFNSDGRANAGSYMVAHAATAEQFALDHLISLYSTGKKSSVDVSDKMIAQAAALALELLDLSDEVQAATTGGRSDRQKNSYNRALALVLDAVAKRYPAPLGSDDDERTDWRTAVVTEAGERFYGVIEVAHGRVPLPADERTTHTTSTPVDEPATPAAPAAPPADDGVALLAEALGATPLPATAFVLPAGAPLFGDPGFLAPSDAQVARVKTLCENAGVIADPTAVSDWLERTVGARATRRVHAPVLEAFLDFYENAGPAVVAAEVGNPHAAA